MRLEWHLTFGESEIFSVTIGENYPDFHYVSSRLPLQAATLIDLDIFHLSAETDDGILYTTLFPELTALHKVIRRIEQDFSSGITHIIPIVVYRLGKKKKLNYCFGYPDEPTKTLDRRFFRSEYGDD